MLPARHHTVQGASRFGDPLAAYCAVHRGCIRVLDLTGDYRRAMVISRRLLAIRVKM